jgi:very-short-patch-repair endonuclease
MRGQSARHPIWELIEKQHGVITRKQLLELGVSAKQIDRRLASGRLHPLWRGVYAVGRPTITPRGWWLAGVLACGDRAVLSHHSAAELWGFRETNPSNEGKQDRPRVIDVSVPGWHSHRLGGIRVHRRLDLTDIKCVEVHRIPVTSPARTLIDLAALMPPWQLEACVNQADKLQRIDPETLRAELEVCRGMNGVPALRRMLDRRTFTLTDSELERRFLRLVRRAGLPTPRTQQRVYGFRVDFIWPELRLIAETDGLRYHRTASQQTRDRERDQTLVAAGFTVLRFTHAQVTYEPEQVVGTLWRVMK